MKKLKWFLLPGLLALLLVSLTLPFMSTYSPGELASCTLTVRWYNLLEFSCFGYGAALLPLMMLVYSLGSFRPAQRCWLILALLLADLLCIVLATPKAYAWLISMGDGTVHFDPLLVIHLLCMGAAAAYCIVTLRRHRWLMAGKDARILRSAENRICSLFSDTGIGGKLVLRDWQHDPAPDFVSRECAAECRMHWTAADRDALIAGFCELYRALKQIAAEEEPERLPEDLYKIWDSLVRRLEPEGFDPDENENVNHRILTMLLRNNDGDPEELEAEELAERWDEAAEYVSEEELEELEAYRAAQVHLAGQRLKNGVAGYPVIYYAQRLCRLIQLEAPQIILENEAINLAQSLVVHRFANTIVEFVLPVSQK